MFIINIDKILDYNEFVCYFGFFKKLVFFFNVKMNFFKRGDVDFMIRLRKFNCVVDMLEDSLRLKVNIDMFNGFYFIIVFIISIEI